MTKYHEQLLALLKENKGGNIPPNFNERYLGNSHIFYGVNTKVKRQIAKDFYKSHLDLPKKDFFQLLKNLYTGKSYEEKSIASELLFFYKNLWGEIELSDIDRFLNHLVGWAEVDNLCQSEILINYIQNDLTATSSFLHKLSEDKNINKRRASLVLLVKPATYLPDKKIFDLSIELIEKLKTEKPILITKAISWILRALSNHHKLEVKNYIEKNKNTLPKIAIRETLKKIETGKK